MMRDTRTLLFAVAAIPAAIFVGLLIEMDTTMAVLLGLLIAARIVFRSDPVGNRATGIALLVWAVALPFMHGESGGFIDTAVLAAAYSVMALGLNIIVGFAGLLDLGYVAFFAIGALATGWFMSNFFSGVNDGDGLHVLASERISALPGIHMNFLLVVVIAVILCAIAGVIIGLPTLRLRGDYIAIVTLAFGEIAGDLVLNGDQLRLFGEQLTNGRQGITPIDPIKLPLIEEFQPLDLRPWFWTALGLMLIVLFVNFRVRDSRLGRAWIALREDEVAAASMGVPLVRTKLMAYGTGAAFGGVSGAFLGSLLNTVNAQQFEFSFSIFILAMIILGGLGSIEGVLAGSVALTYINFRLIPELRDVPSTFGLNFDLTELSFGIFGFLLVIMMVLRPEGLLPERRRQLELEGIAGVGETAGVGGAGPDPVYEARA